MCLCKGVAALPYPAYIAALQQSAAQPNTTGALRWWRCNLVIEGARIGVTVSPSNDACNVFLFYLAGQEAVNLPHNDLLAKYASGTQVVLQWVNR